jgi:hypothetical protein
MGVADCGYENRDPPMTDSSSPGDAPSDGRSIFRPLFVAAAVVNLALSVWILVFPVDFAATIDGAANPASTAWRWFGIMGGFHGTAFLWLAVKPRSGSLVSPFVLGSMIAGLSGWILSLRSGVVESRSFPVVAAGSLAWCYLLLFHAVEGRRYRRRTIALASVAVHLIASLALLGCGGGTVSNPDMAGRMEWVTAHLPWWSSTWLLWTASSMGLLPFCLVWSGRLLELGASRTAVVAGCLMVSAGLLFDLTGEAIQVMGPSAPGLTLEDFSRASRGFDLLSAGVANGLYCAGGLLLSVQAWKSGLQRGWAGIAAFTMWAVGMSLTAAAIFNHRLGMLASGAGVMILFIPWAAWTAFQLDRQQPGRGKSATRPL